MASRAAKSAHVGMTLHEVEVGRVERLSPHLTRVTVVGDSLRRFRDDGPDQRIKLLLPRAGQDRPRTPGSGPGWYAEWRRMPPAERPVLRTYTVAAARPAARELDLDMIVHDSGPCGPGSRWAGSAAPGDRAALYGAYAEYEPPHPGADQLVVGDLSALPAVAAIVDRLPARARARVLLECAGVDRRALAAHPGLELEWIDPDVDQGADQGAAPGAALARAVTRATAARRPDYAWVAGDRDTVARIRRHLVRQRGLPPERVMFMGYWRTDGAIDPE